MDDVRRKTLEDAKADAISRCQRLFPKVQYQERELERIKNEYRRWKGIYESADRELAESDRKQILKAGSGSREKKLILKLSNDQIRRIAEALGVEL